jgi:hypothetical protein
MPTDDKPRLPQTPNVPTQTKGMFMEYIIAFAVGTMIAGYTLIIRACLKDS